MKTKRPTAAQLDVLRKMKDGWLLAEYSSPLRGTFIRLGMAGTQGDDLSRYMLRNLLDSGAIAIERTAFAVMARSTYYRLTPAGLAALHSEESK